MVNSERVDFDGKVLCCKRQKKFKGLPVSFDGLLTTSLYAGKIATEEFKVAHCRTIDSCDAADLQLIKEDIPCLETVLFN